jgi:VWFA-related protein
MFLTFGSEVKLMMKKFVVIWLVIVSLFSISAAQSGRRTAIEPATETIRTTETETDFSESVSRKPRIAAPEYSNSKKRIGDRAEKKIESGLNSQNETAGDELVKIETNLVTIPVSVFDRNGLYISNLRQQDFKIFEDGKEQEIAYFGTSEKPFTVVLLLDTSPSTEYKIEEIQKAAIAFVDQLKMQDKVMVIEFDANINVLTEATNNRQKIYKAIKKADFGGGTSLYDTVDFSLRKRLNNIEGRKAIVLFTDGVDTTSYKSGYDTTLQQAEEADALIFPIYYNTFLENLRNAVDTNAPGMRAADYAVGKQYVEELAEATGGRVFRPDATPGGLTSAFEGIAEELRRQYNLGYYPSDEARAGQRKQIKVRVNRPNLVIRSRDGYVVGTENKSAQNAAQPK